MRYLLPKPASLALVFAVSAAQAGEVVEGYIYVIGSIPSTVPTETMEDWGRALFRDTRAELSTKWSRDCGTLVQIEHTSLMDNQTAPWASGYWVAYLAFEQTIAATRAAVPATDCAKNGYIKATTILSPSIIYYCEIEAKTLDEYPLFCQ